MGVARGLERRLERLVDGLASRLFKGRIHPLELGTMLAREADLALVDGPAGPTAPNRYRIVMGGDDVEAEVLHSVALELGRFVEDAAADRGWRLEGPARVEITISPERRAGDVDITTGFEKGESTPWALLDPLDPHASSLPVAHIRALVGRSTECDVVLRSDTVSRRHAVIWQEGGAAWIADLDSSNGTYLNHDRIAEPSRVVAGDIVAFGDEAFTVREP